MFGCEYVNMVNVNFNDDEDYLCLVVNMFYANVNVNFDYDEACA